jgi:hypothetical protein
MGKTSVLQTPNLARRSRLDLRRIVSWAAAECQDALLIVAIGAFGGALGCANDPATTKTSDPAAKEQLGTIERVGTFGYGIVPDRDPGTRYAPDRLAKEFEVDGLRVLFSGREIPPPPGVRQWGTPFHLETIRRAPAPSP